MEKYVNSWMTEKCIISGNRIEFYKYSIPICFGFKRHPVMKIFPTENDGKRSDNLTRARQNVRRLIWCNLTPYTKFLTLTVAENISDKKIFKCYMKNFFQSMRRQGYDLQYVYVYEYQKRGALHAHLVVFNAEYLPRKVLSKSWPYGVFHIKVLNGLKNGSKERINDVGSYVSKYITKDTVNQIGEHCYECSQGLKRPESYKKFIWGEYGRLDIRDSIFAEDTNNEECKIFNEYSELAKITHSSTNCFNISRYPEQQIIQVIDYSTGYLPKEVLK